MSRQPVPAAFAHLVDLAAEETGTLVLYATDEYFAPKESLIRRGAPVWRDGEYTDRGKWMDGWESARRREAGHDFVIVRLGTPGEIHGLLCDTTHFTGNAPQAVSAEVCEAPDTITAAELVALPAADATATPAAGRCWREVLPRTEVRPDHRHELTLAAPSPRATHLRFHIYPDGGAARLRVYGVARPDPRLFWRHAAIDLAAVEHGGTIVAASDEHFASPFNLLLPGRGATMGDGWETARRRTPGSDWCVIALGRRGIVERIEIDTYLYKGNAPQAARVECLDAAAAVGAEELARRLRAADGWDVLVDEAALAPHRNHVLVPAHTRPATHLKLHIVPHGGVNRFRAFGDALDTAAERVRLDELQALAPAAAEELLRSFCGAIRWARELAGARPFASVRALLAAAGDAFWRLGEADLLEAFAAHPRIGDTAKPAAATARSAEWSGGEQAGVAGAREEIVHRLAAGNAAYLERFGFTFICYATGRSAADMLQELERRLANTRGQEIGNAAHAQARITRLRMDKWLLGQ